MREEAYMYSFLQTESGVAIQKNGKILLKDLRPFMNPNPKPRTKMEETGLFYLEPVEITELSVDFAAPALGGKLSLSLKEKGDCFAIFAKGAYDPAGLLGVGNHLDPYKGLGFDFDLPHDGNYVDAYMGCEFWQRPYIHSELSALKPRTQALLANQEDERIYLHTTCHRYYKSEIFPQNTVARLVASSNTVLDDVDECLLVAGCGENAVELTEEVTEFGIKIMGKAGKLRKYKRYPEVFEYLGWCSWDAFHMDVTAQNLLDKAQEFSDKEIPVRWMIIDDMWGDVNCIDRKTMHTRELNSWEADPKRFPQGLKGAVSDLKERYDLKIGIWHPISGYWHGINPLSPLAKEQGELLEYTIPSPTGGDSRLIHSFDGKKAEKYYDRQHDFYKSCGIDFTKVDNQGSLARFSYLRHSIGEAAANLHEAIEKATRKYYDGALINCMGMPVENFWNRGHSNLNRFSGDFMPEDRNWFIKHLLQCSYNSLIQGAAFTGDWDMWWSNDGQGKKNAVLRSMSGGPIYLSDELDRSVREVILPLVFSDGRILRLENPAIPTDDCLFEDATTNGKVFKIFNRIGDCGIVAAFNLDEEERPVSGVLSAVDAECDSDGRYAVYDWFAGTCQVLEVDQTLPLTLKNYDDFGLYILAPIKRGKAVIGLKEKYMAPAAVKKGRTSVEALDDGTMLVFSERTLDGFTPLGNGLYEKPMRKKEKILL